MKATKELVWGLRRAAARVVDPKEGYNWSCPDRCNCGLLVRELLGLSEIELNKIRNNTRYRLPYEISREVGAWGAIGTLSTSCALTGLPLGEIVEQLKEVGFEVGDFAAIEFLRWRHFGLPEGTYCYKETDPQEVSKFFLLLADKLEKELPQPISGREQPLEVSREAYRLDSPILVG